MRRAYSPDRLRSFRLAGGITRATLAEAVRLSPVTIAAYEVGRRIPSAHTIGALADVLGCRVDDLYLIDPAAGTVTPVSADGTGAPPCGRPAGPDGRGTGAMTSPAGRTLTKRSTTAGTTGYGGAL